MKSSLLLSNVIVFCIPEGSVLLDYISSSNFYNDCLQILRGEK